MAMESAPGRITVSLYLAGRKDHGLLVSASVTVVDEIGQRTLPFITRLIKAKGISGAGSPEQNPAHRSRRTPRPYGLGSGRGRSTSSDGGRCRPPQGLRRPLLPLHKGPLPRHVMIPQDDVLSRDDDGFPIGRREDVVGRHHQDSRFGLGLDRQGHVDGHLVPVEVGVVGGADEGVKLDGLALDQDRLKGLDAQPVEGRSPVEHHRVFPDHVVEHVPDLGSLLLEHLLGALDRRDEPLVLEAMVDERFEELQGHLLGQAALVELEIGTDDDDGTAGIVDPLAEQVLPEAALFAAEHVAQEI